MTVRTYATPLAFKQALEQRLRALEGGSSALVRRRQLVVFERFLARIGVALGEAAVLKGGLVLELRLARARTTKDVDLRLMGSADGLLERLQAAGQRELGDWMSFEIALDQDHPELRGDGIKYEGRRFRAECKLAGKLYGNSFGVDVAFGDPILGEPQLATGMDHLAFAGVAPPTLRLYPIESHLAEKLHAYTLPRLRPNTRVKDLPDLALLAGIQRLDASRLWAALDQTFSFRDTHSVPARLPAPPAEWAVPYASMAAADGLAWSTLDEVAAAASAFLDPVLGGARDAEWDPERWTWITRSSA